MLQILLIPLLLLDATLLYFLIKRRDLQKAVLYFCLSRLALITALVIAYIDYVRFGSAFGGGNLIHLLPSSVYCILIATTALNVFLAGIYRKLSLITTAAACIAIASFVFLHLSIQNSSFRLGPVKNLNNSHEDNQTARDFQLLSQDIQRYLLDKNALPPTLSDVINVSSSYSKEEDVESRISKYTYNKIGSNSFQLCATFTTDTAAENPEPGANGVTQAYYHRHGYQCFDFGEF